MMFLSHSNASKLPALDVFRGLGKRVAWRLLVPVFVSAHFATGCTWIPTMVNQGIDAAIVVAEHRSFYSVAEDYAIKSEVEAKILDENLALDVRTDVYQGRVMLTGVVPAAADRKRAESAAKQVKGAGEVFNEIQVSDENLVKVWLTGVFRQIKLKLKLIEAESVTSINYRWRAVDDVVYFLGSAADGEEMARVVSIAQNMGGVRKVVTHISLRSVPAAPPPAPIYTVKLPKPDTVKLAKSVPVGTKAKPARTLAAASRTRH
jgi:osmotically-inducible protein OsmY